MAHAQVDRPACRQLQIDLSIRVQVNGAVDIVTAQCALHTQLDACARSSEILKTQAVLAQRVIGQPGHQHHRAVRHRGAVRPAQVSAAVKACQVNHPTRVQRAALHRHRNRLVLHRGTLTCVHHSPQLATAFKRVLVHQTGLRLLHCFSGVEKQR